MNRVYMFKMLLVVQDTGFHSDHTLCSYDKTVFVCFIGVFFYFQFRLQITASVVLVFVFATVTTNKVSSSSVSTMHASFLCDFFFSCCEILTRHHAYYEPMTV